MLRLHDEGKSVCDITAEVHLDRKQVVRVLTYEGIKNSPLDAASESGPRQQPGVAIRVTTAAVWAIMRPIKRMSSLSKSYTSSRSMGSLRKR